MPSRYILALEFSTQNLKGGLQQQYWLPVKGAKVLIQHMSLRPGKVLGGGAIPDSFQALELAQQAHT